MPEGLHRADIAAIEFGRSCPRSELLTGVCRSYIEPGAESYRFSCIETDFPFEEFGEGDGHICFECYCWLKIISCLAMVS